jgi:hypothetical protein
VAGHVSDHDKMMAFGNWLASKMAVHQSELFSLSINTKAPVDAMRIKAGHVECTGHVLNAYRELYNSSDLNKWMEDYLGKPPEEEDKESTDGPSASAT